MLPVSQEVKLDSAARSIQTINTSAQKDNRKKLSYVVVSQCWFNPPLMSLHSFMKLHSCMQLHCLTVSSRARNHVDVSGLLR